MGGCVVSLMEQRSRLSTVPNEDFQDYQRRARAGSFIDEMPGSGSDSCSASYRLAGLSDEAQTRFVHDALHGLTFPERLRELSIQRADKPVCAHRPVTHVVREEVMEVRTGTRKLMDVTYFGATNYLTYRELWEQAVDLGLGLAKLGLQPRSTVAIYLETCAQWVISIYGLWSQNMVATTVYANLGEDALSYALHETSSAAVVCGAASVGSLVKLMVNGAIHAVPILYVGALDPSVATHGLDVIRLEDAISMGRLQPRSAPDANTAPAATMDVTALIMYTSGTTGNPKGVVHTHGSLACGASIIMSRITDLLGEPTDEEVYCSYLPLAHIMEFTLVNISIFRGAMVGFGSPRTLMDTTARPHGDLTEYKPLFLVAVPRVLDTLRKAVEAKLPPVGSLKRTVFDRAYQSRLQALKEGKDTPYWNEKVFNKIRAALGGRTVVLLSGGGPLSAATQEWVNVVFGSCLIGWGLTETVCVGAIQLRGDPDLSVAGLMEPGEELKLVDVEEFKHTDKPEPRGEICLRGPFLFKGYYKQPELTREALDAGGWFHTGDVGSITSSGKVRIVGRVKALAKNALGEYIALEALETIYSNHPLVADNCACVLVHPDRNYIAVLAVTDEARVRRFAAEHNIAGEFPQVMHSADFRKAAAESLAAMGAAAKRKPFEQPRAVHFVTDAWTPENGVLTAAMKLKRRVIDVEYADAIKELFLEA